MWHDKSRFAISRSCRNERGMPRVPTLRCKCYGACTEIRAHHLASCRFSPPLSADVRTIGHAPPASSAAPCIILYPPHVCAFGRREGAVPPSVFVTPSESTSATATGSGSTSAAGTPPTRAEGAAPDGGARTDGCRGDGVRLPVGTVAVGGGGSRRAMALRIADGGGGVLPPPPPLSDELC